MKQSLITSFVRLFGRVPEVVSQAPGRIEFIGNHTDYNGGVVMGVALDKTVMVALAKRTDRKLIFASAKSGEKIAVDLDDLKKQEREYNWVNYPLGVFKYLIEAGLKADCGFDMLDCSNLPAGAGLSSSAAIELASAFAMAKLYDFQADLKTLVRIGRKCENHFVGMPCGILDQGVSGFGKKDGIVFIDCLTEDFSTYPLPSNCKFWLFNSTKKHALVDGLYAERHSECMQASKVLSEGGESRPLRSFNVNDLEAVKDKLSDVVYRRAKHVIEENSRVMKAKELLLAGDISGVGKLLNASHESSRKLFENSCEELDFLVDTVSTMKGVYGARLSGGGFGGAVMALTDESFSQEDADKVSEIYEQKFGKKPMVFTCASGDGAKVI
ncbi:MAG: galactokinase [Opitutales bacterium]|nr:galactokinase [Opitutales bacterium]